MEKTKILFMWFALITLSTNISYAQNLYSTSGNVGIGTTTPTARLDIISNTGQTETLTRFRISDASNDYLSIANATGSANQFIPSFRGHHESDNRYSIQFIGSTSPTNDTGTNALVNFDARRSAGPIETRPLFTWTSYTTKMMTMSANGNLGLGTTTPNAKLDVRGSIKTSYSDNRYVNLFNSGDGNSYMNIQGGSDSSRFGFQVDGSSKMSIMKNGNVGIGTSSPDSKLSVNGKIHAKEVKIDLSIWPDYVFKETYSLPPLEKVENHILEKGHLKNIPSAEEVEKNGVQLGEMNIKLLEKIEELTLYMIEQHKKTEQLQKEVMLLRNKNIELENKIKKL